MCGRTHRHSRAPLAVHAGRLYVGALGVGFRVYDIVSNPSRPRLIALYVSPHGAPVQAHPTVGQVGRRTIVALSNMPTRQGDAGTSDMGHDIEDNGIDRNERIEFVDVTDASLANPPRLLATLWIVDERFPAIPFCRTALHFVRLGPSLTERAAKLGEWLPPHVARAPVGTDFENSGRLECINLHYGDTADDKLYVGSHGRGGTRVVDLAPLKGLMVADSSRQPITLGWYIPDNSGNGWDAHQHRGYVYSSDAPTGLNVFTYKRR